MQWDLRNSKHVSLIALGLLVLQNTTLVLLMRGSLIKKEEATYLTSTAVTMMEVLKLLMCCILVYMALSFAGQTDGYIWVTRMIEEPGFRIPKDGKIPTSRLLQQSAPESDRYLDSVCQTCYPFLRDSGAFYHLECGGFQAFIKKMEMEVASKPRQIARLLIPAVLYTVQNNLLYHALANLDAATYSVFYQSKILTTALFSVLLLKKRLTLWKWGALILLTVGVALTEVANATTTHSAQSPMVGFICVMTAACTSGFAGVYFEMLLKSSRTSLWIRNIQMGIPSILMALLGVVFNDGAMVASRGFFQGYNSIVIAVIVLQAAGGLVVAVVVKYADNIKKSFAAALSIVTSCLFSMILFRFRPNGTFMFGLILVCVSVSMYSRRTSEKALPLVSGPAFNSVELNRRRGTSRRI